MTFSAAASSEISTLKASSNVKINSTISNESASKSSKNVDSSLISSGSMPS